MRLLLGVWSISIGDNRRQALDDELHWYGRSGREYAIEVGSLATDPHVMGVKHIIHTHRRNLTQRFMPPDRSFLTTTICPPLSPAQIQPVECRTPVSLIKQMISPTSRYQAALRNMRSRRGRDLEIVVPVYKDENTPSPFRLPAEPPKECGNTEDSGREGNDLSIKLDPSMAAQYACSLQVTMQASNITEARDLHDQLLPLSPIMLALSAATSIWNGVLADTDVRWNGASAVVDDRTPEEFGDKVSFVSQTQTLKLTARLSRHWMEGGGFLDHGSQPVTHTSLRTLDYPTSTRSQTYQSTEESSNSFSMAEWMTV